MRAGALPPQSQHESRGEVSLIFRCNVFVCSIKIKKTSNLKNKKIKMM